MAKRGQKAYRRAMLWQSGAWMGGVMLLAVLAMLLIACRTHTSASELPQTASNNWPMYQHDPAHSGRTPATIANGGPLYLQWAYSFGERVEVEAQPVISGSVIYQGVMNGEMHAIDADTGSSLWIERPGGPIPHTAAVAGSRVYFGSLDGSVYALAAADGHTVWQFQTGGPVVSAPAVVDGRLYIGSNDGNLYVLDSVTGAELWRVETGGPVVSSPAVANGLVYFGSEDMIARCIDPVQKQIVWAVPLHGAGMHNTHPVISDDGDVVIFVTVKPGGSSYVPLEDYPNAASGADPVTTWNSYYQAHPVLRTLYYLDAATGADLWNPTANPPRYVPLPIPYWTLLHPILASDGSAVFPAPAGTANHQYGLDHDNRLFRVDLSTGATTQVAGGSLPEFQLRFDEVGRHVFSGDDYYYTISEDLGVYRPDTGTMRALFSNGDPPGYNFGSHMNPLSPLPSRHLWRYGGTVAMGGVPGASPPIVANGMVYYTSYSWLYAVGPTDHGYDPATSFPARDARLHELTYPRSDAPTPDEIQAEIAARVADIVALGPESPPLAVRWEQADKPMDHNEFNFEVYGFEADMVRVLAEAYPYLSTAQQTQLRAYLSALVTDTLLDADHYASTYDCLRFGEDGVQTGDDCQSGSVPTARWLAGNPNLIALRLYALWAYADATGDWSSIESHWSLITQQFQKFVDAYDPDLGFCYFEEWRVKRLNLPAQIEMAQAVRDMAAHLGHTSTQAQAATLLNDLLDTRVALADFVPHLYDIGEREPAHIRLNPDGTINNEDIMQGSPYNNELIPYSAEWRNRDTDPSQVNWWDGSAYRVDAGLEFMHYPALSGYFPLSSELITRLRSDLLTKTAYYVKSYTVNNPWWWMSDLAHHTTGSGEYLYHSPTLAWTLFQVKAWVLQEDWNTLARQLPEPVSFNSRYDLYRLQNLVTLLSLSPTPAPPPVTLTKTVRPVIARQGDTLTYTISLADISGTVTISDSVPGGAAYVTGSAHITPPLGDLSADAALIRWTGDLTTTTALTLTFAATVTVAAPTAIVNTAAVAHNGQIHILTATSIANGLRLYLPILLKEYFPGTLRLPRRAALSPLRRANLPHFPDTVRWAESAIFWFGRVDPPGAPGQNYSDVRLAYTDSELVIYVNIEDYYLWYYLDGMPGGDPTDYDAVALYLDTAHDRAASPQPDDYLFISGLCLFQCGDGSLSRAESRGSGSGWDTTWTGAWDDSKFAAWLGNPPHNNNDNTFDFGWWSYIHLPWETLGLTGPPPAGTTWGLGLTLYDRDDMPPAGAVAPQTWPQAADISSPATWGEIHFGLAAYTPPAAIEEGTTLIRRGIGQSVVEDTWVGGGGTCSGGHNGDPDSDTNGTHPDLYVENQELISDLPCFSKSFLRFRLDPIPAGKTIISAALTLHQWSNADWTRAQPSPIWLLTVDGDWEEDTLTWNNAPPARENLTLTWVDVITPGNNPGRPGNPYTWDATQAVAESYAAGAPLDIALYTADINFHSSKYLTSSDTEDWNAVARPLLTVVWGTIAQEPGLTKSARTDAAGHGTSLQPGGLITYTLHITGSGQALTVTDVLPTGVSHPLTYTASDGSVAYVPTARRLTWTGTPTASQAITLTFPVTTTHSGPYVIINTAHLTSATGATATASVMVVVDPVRLFLPCVLRGANR